ncbi:MAG: VWA domain-containing protein [Trueperaceae bacterium]
MFRRNRNELHFTTGRFRVLSILLIAVFIGLSGLAQDGAGEQGSTGIELVGVPDFDASEWFIYDEAGDRVAREWKGEWKFVTLPPGRYTVAVKPGDTEVEWAEVEVSEGQVTRVEVLSGVELVGVPGHDAPEWYIYDEAGDRVAREWKGEWKFVALPPGRYTVAVKPGDTELEWAEVEVSEGQVIRVEVLSGVELVGVPGHEAPQWYIYEASGDRVAREWKGEWKFVVLPPGRYTVAVTPGDAEVEWAEVEVSEGQVTRVEVLSGVELVPLAGHEPPEVWYVFDHQGELQAETENRWGFTVLLPGTYHVASVLPRGEDTKEVRWAEVEVGEGRVSSVDMSMAAAGVIRAQPLVGTPATYTLTAEFDGGTPVNVTSAGDELKLVDEPVPFNFIWVAASRRGTVIKIDTTTGEILGEYLSAPDGRGRDTSRTTVDADGNAWAGNRGENEDGKGSVVKIGLLENNQCADRNGNGEIDTSTGLGDILPWPQGADADDDVDESTAEDECVILYTRVAGTATRTVAVDGNNDLWTGGYDRAHGKIDGSTGEPVVGTEFNLGCGGYGGLIDSNGVLWSARYGGLLRFDTTTMSGECLGLDVGNYGLGIDTVTGEIWHTKEVQDGVCKLAPSGALLGCFEHGDAFAKGVAVDRDGNVWVAHGNLAGASPTVGRLRTDGTFVGNVDLLDGSGPTGVAVDANDKIWVTNANTDDVMRIDPRAGPLAGGGFPLGAVDLIVDLGPDATPYNYSDMTGSTLAAVPDSGTWTVVHDSGAPGTSWQEISWQAEPQDSGSITVTAASSVDGADFSEPATVASGEGLDLPAGRYLRVEVRFERLDSGSSPVLYDLTVSAREVARGPGRLRVIAADEEADAVLGAPPRIALILDGSNSMWAQIEGRSRIEIAKEVMAGVIADLPEDVRVAMRLYGHRVHFSEAGACQDSELVFPFGPVDKTRLLQLVAGIQPRGTTPIAFSLRQVAGDFGDEPGEKLVLLVTDGIEECGGSPAEAVTELLDQGLDVRINIVGFDLADEAAKAEMEQVAELSGGRYFDAADSGELLDGIKQSLAVPFTVLDASGGEVASGHLGDEGVALPAGTYRTIVHAAGTALEVPDVAVAAGQRTTVELGVGSDGLEASVVGP